MADKDIVIGNSHAHKQSNFLKKIKSKSMAFILQIKPVQEKVFKQRQYQEKTHKKSESKKQTNEKEKDLKNKLEQQVNHNLIEINYVKESDIIHRDLSQKMKSIAERSLRKLEGRYETIDRWKQKYIPDMSPYLIIKSKAYSQNNYEEEKQRLPPIHRPQFYTGNSEQNKIETEYLAKVEKSYRIHEVKSIIVERQINYFQEGNPIIPPEKKREIELKKYLMKVEKKLQSNNSTNGLFYKKIELKQLQKSPKNEALFAGSKVRYEANLSKKLNNPKKTVCEQKQFERHDSELSEYVKQKYREQKKRLKQQEMLKMISESIPEGWKYSQEQSDLEGIPTNSQLQQQQL